ncbi:Ig-like domain-containing protein [uncultured Microbacterium sp.]|uniref:Ig-like domain-containing protein n=1 Tax=uncultured Microbacterium sp. TaxID=191216 RepID=UPI0025DC86D6|nr:Ig-like domain-containing protein [uncultured Microbacterium sp.]
MAAVASPTPAIAATTVDVTTNVSGPTNAVAGSAFTYTVTVGNNSLTAADGASLSVSMPAGAVNVAATCAAADGAACPSPLNVSDRAITGTVSTLPHLGVVTLTITGNFSAASASSVTATSRVDPPDGATDSDPSSNTSSVSTAIDTSADLAVSTSPSATSTSPGSPITWTVTYANNGPAPADGASINQLFFWSGSAVASMANGIQSCTGTGGATCPTFVRDSTTSSFQSLWAGTVAAFPAGASIQVVFTSSPNFVCGATEVTSTTSINAPSTVSDTNKANNSTNVKVMANSPGCAPTELTVMKTQTPGAATPTAPITYTVTYANNGPAAADNATIRDLMYWTGNMVGPTASIDITSCVGAGGATCPAFVKDTSVFSFGDVWSGQVGAFPVGATLTITYTSTFTFISCGTGTVTNQTTIAAPAGMTNTAGDRSRSQVNGVLNGGECAKADLGVTISQSAVAENDQVPTVYTATYTNNGPSAADGSNIKAFAFWSENTITRMKASILSCTTTGGAVCPTLADSSPFSFASVFDSPVATYPSGSSITVKYTLVPAITTCGPTANVTTVFETSTRAGMTDPISTNNRAQSTTKVTCADISVNKVVTPRDARANEPVSFAITVTNSSPNTAKSIQFTDPLPSGFVYGAASCTASTGSACGPVSYDPDSRTVSSTIFTLGAGAGFVKILVQGTAGLIPGTYKNTATVVSSAGPDAIFDPNATSNSSTVSLQLFNTLSTIAVTKSITGLPSAGLPVDQTFSGTIICSGQPSQPWSVTVPAGRARATGSPAQFWDGGTCAIEEDPAPTPPDSFSYSGPATFSPASIATLGPTQSLTFTSTTPTALAADPIAVDDDAQTAQGEPVTVDAIANDSGTRISVTAVGPNPTGTAEITTDGRLRFTPNGDFSGTTVMSYTITDELGRTATANITVRVSLKPSMNATPAPEPTSTLTPESVSSSTPKPTVTASIGPTATVDAPTGQLATTGQTLPVTAAVLSVALLGLGLVAFLRERRRRSDS